MLISSLTKLSRYTGLELSNKTSVNAYTLVGWQLAVSKSISKFISRELEIKQRVEFLDLSYRKLNYYLSAYPVLSVSEVQADFRGQFNTTSDYNLQVDTWHLNRDNTAVTLNYPIPVNAYKGLRVTYVGGLAYHPTKSVWTVTATGNIPVTTFGENAVTYYASNEERSYLAMVSAVSGSSLTLDHIYGEIEAGAELKFYTTEGGLPLDGISATITANQKLSLAETYPDIERAAEIEVRYMQKHQHDFENASTMDNQTQRRSYNNAPYLLQPEARALLAPYVRMYLEL